TQRYDFLRENFKKTGEKIFRFNVLQHRVLVVSGNEARKVFFNDPGLQLGEGYQILMGGAPRLSDINMDLGEAGRDTAFIKKLLHLLRRDRVASVLPTLFDDVNRRMLTWGKEGTLNPFKEVYELVFQMTIRLATCRELSEDTDAITRLAQHYWDIEKSATPVALLLPWFPGPAKRSNKRATQELYTLISNFVDMRRKSPEPTMDAFDLLISEGESNEVIVGFVMGVIFAGVINTGMIVCWALLHLGTQPEWKAKVAAEIKALVQNHTNPSSPEPLHKRLSGIPMEAWEDELPVLDVVIRETIRLTMSGTLLRRNLSNDIPIAHATAKSGDFLAYHIPDVHRNTEIYSNPEEFDPDRYSPGREEDKRAPLGFLGWGVGRHPCAGMRIAKLEMKLIMVLLFDGYDFKLVDSAGNDPRQLPQPDKNDLQQVCPPKLRGCNLPTHD
ncbi:cytochrome P450, partial [Infundibulicybe gibba]